MVGLEAKNVAEIVRWRRLCVAESTKKGAVTTSLGNDELRKFAGRRMDPIGQRRAPKQVIVGA
jgi:hypothetical protein